MNSITTQTPPSSTANLPEAVLQSILESLSGLRFGQVTVIVQDGRVIQIDRTERRRFTTGKEAAGNESTITAIYHWQFRALNYRNFPNLIKGIIS